MKAVDRTSAKLSTWPTECRIFAMLDDNEDNMVGGSRLEFTARVHDRGQRAAGIFLDSDRLETISR